MHAVVTVEDSTAGEHTTEQALNCANWSDFAMGEYMKEAALQKTTTVHASIVNHTVHTFVTPHMFSSDLSNFSVHP